MTLVRNLLPRRLFSNLPGGYSLIETITVVVILGVLATVTVRSLQNGHDSARMSRTRVTLDKLAQAITGNPELVSGGARIDFGYVGDIGALPPDLTALVINPGGYTTWNGPYVGDHFELSGTATALLKDGWGKVFVYSGTNLIQSTGSGTNISRSLANSLDHILYNSLNLTILDLDQHPPGSVFKDSVRISLTIPDGAGSMIVRSIYPSRDGSVVIDSIPIGRHSLRTIYLPSSDTLTRMVAIEPGQSDHLQISFPTCLW